MTLIFATMADIDGSCQRHNGPQIESAAMEREFCTDRPSISPGREMDPRLPPRPQTFARLIKGAARSFPRAVAAVFVVSKTRNTSTDRVPRSAEKVLERAQKGAPVLCKFMRARSCAPCVPPSFSTQTTTRTTRSAIGLSDTRAASNGPLLPPVRER